MKRMNLDIKKSCMSMIINLRSKKSMPLHGQERKSNSSINWRANGVEKSNKGLNNNALHPFLIQISKLTRAVKPSNLRMF